MATKTISESSEILNVNPNVPVGPVLQMVDGRPVVSSVKIAEHFKKPHNRVLAVIRSTMKGLPDDFRLSNFRQTVTRRPMPQGKGYRDDPSFDIARDGFTLIVMGFTGMEALAWKLRYIEAFNAMEAELSHRTDYVNAVEAMEAELMAPVSPAGTLTATQQQEIKELVQAKASAFPDAVKRKVFSQIWTRIQRKFKVPRYEELPAGLFGEARDYVIAMQIRSVDAPALPQAENLALPPATPDPDLEAKLRRLRSLKQEMMDVSAEVYRVVKRGMRPRASDYGKPAGGLAVNMNYLLDDVFYTMDRNLDAVEHLCVAGKLMPQVLPASAGAGG